MLHQCFWSTHQLAVVVYTSQYLFLHSRLTFTVSMFIAHFIEALWCINLMTWPFRISEWFQLQWLDCIQKVDFFFTILDQEKWHFSPSAAFARKKRTKKYPVLHGHHSIQKNTEWSWRQDTSLGDFPCALWETRRA